MPKPYRTAHDFNEKWRSNDVRLQEQADFSSMLLSERVLAGLEKSGFKVPSPIQIESIPVGRFGRDLVVQAKSGTGKTLVFTIIALEALLEVKCPQVLVLVPTREIATQIRDVFRSVGSEINGLLCNSFIGGMPVDRDVENLHGCQIVVGTPGRIKQLIILGCLATNSIRLLVLDEADVLLEPSFKGDIDFIFMSLPKEKQVIATSATYPKELKSFTSQYFRDVFLARLDENKLALLGIVHYIYRLPLSKMPLLAYKFKVEALEKILNSIQFTQCLVFCNLISRVETLCYDIRKWGFTSTFISSAKEQCDRLRAIDCLKRFRCKVLVSSDLTSRGIDAENVDLIINFDKPNDTEVYMHRCGRAGRYGSKGVAITFLTEDEILLFEKVETGGSFRAYTLPDPVPPNLINLRAKECDESSDSKDAEVDMSLSSNAISLNGNANSKKENCETSVIENKLPKEQAELNIFNNSTESCSNESEYLELLEMSSLIDSEGDLERSPTLRKFNFVEGETMQEEFVTSGTFIKNKISNGEIKNVCDSSQEHDYAKSIENRMNGNVCEEPIIKKITSTLLNDCMNANDSEVFSDTKEHDLQIFHQGSKSEIYELNSSSEIKEIIHEEIVDNMNICTDDDSSSTLNDAVKSESLIAIHDCQNVIQHSEITSASSKDFEANKLAADVHHVSPENSTIVSISNSLGFQATDEMIELNNFECQILKKTLQLQDKFSEQLQDTVGELEKNVADNPVVNKIHIPIVKFLNDCDKNKSNSIKSILNRSKDDAVTEDCSENTDSDSSLISDSKMIMIHQIENVRSDLSDFYQKVFKTYQSECIDETAYNDMKMRLILQDDVKILNPRKEFEKKIVSDESKAKSQNQNEQRNAQNKLSCLSNSEEKCKKLLNSSREKKRTENTSDSESSESLSFVSNNDLESQPNSDRAFEKYILKDIINGDASSEKSDSSLNDNLDHSSRRLSSMSSKGSPSNTSLPESIDVNYYREVLHDSLKKAKMFSSRAYEDEEGNDNIISGDDRTNLYDSTEQSSAFKLNSADKNGSSEGEVEHDVSNFEKRQTGNKSNCIDERQQGARRKTYTFKNRSHSRQHDSEDYSDDSFGSQRASSREVLTKEKQTFSRTRNMKKHTSEFSEGDSISSYDLGFLEKAKSPKSCVPNSKKNKMKQNGKKGNEYVPNLNSSGNNYSKPHCGNRQSYQHFPAYATSNQMASPNVFCSNHRCHGVTGNSVCFENSCASWYQTFFRQWEYIQMFSGRKIPANPCVFKTS